MAAFFNPYLAGGRLNGAHRKRSSVLRIVPRGVMYDGEVGLIKHVSDAAPRMFYRDAEHLLVKGMRWPTVGRSGGGGARAGDGTTIKFHLYDVTETLSFLDTDEVIYPSYRKHIIPSGNVIRLFGVVEDGGSVCVNVFGQRAYFYCEYASTEELQELVLDLASTVPDPRHPCSVTVKRVHLTSFYGYNTTCVANLHRVACSDWSMGRKIAKAMGERGIPLYESNVDPATRFLVSRKICSFGWCAVTGHVRPTCHGSSTCDLEIDCEVGDVSSLDEGDISWPTYRCLSFDIECMSGSAGFPVAENQDDIVIQISCVCFDTGGSVEGDDVGKRGGSEGGGDDGSAASGIHLFTVGPCADIEGAHVYEFPSEFEMLLGFFMFVREYGPVFLTGYNINAFDLKYLLTRMEKIYRTPVGEYTKLRSGGRFVSYVPADKQRQGFASAHTKVIVTGTVVVDMYPVCMAKISAPNYKLNTVAEFYLGRTKDDLSYKDIPKQFVLSDAGRAKVGRYCIQDAVLVRDLFNTVKFHYEAAAVARLARIPLRKAVLEGQQTRIYTSLLEEASRRGMVLPDKKTGVHLALESEGDPPAVGYQGATVLEPDTGYYDTPVAVFDFASLYPSIIMAHNLCYTTLVKDVDAYPAKDGLFVVSIGDGVRHAFVRDDVRRSVLADLLTRWLSRRKAVRESMKACPDPFTRMLLDKEQLALKVTCNAFYGFTGFTAGILPCIPVAASVTCIGRQMLSRTADFIHESFADEAFVARVFDRPDDYVPGRPFSAKVIYGDTDSVFVNIIGVRPEAVERAAGYIAEYVTKALFTYPVKLEFEKTFAALMMICKKRYIGRATGSNRLVMKGVDLVRKTACRFVKTIVTDVLSLLFDDPAVAASAVELSGMTTEQVKMRGVPEGFHAVLLRLCRARDALYLNDVDVDDLVLSAVLSQDISRYKQKNLPHLAVIRKLAARSEELPGVGDRVQYVLTETAAHNEKGVPNYELAEDPAYVKQNGVRINAGKYFDQSVKAVANAIGPVFPKDAEKRDRFLYSVLPLRVYLPREFARYGVPCERYHDRRTTEQ